MKMPTISLIEWQKKFGTEKACTKVLAKVRWPQGFQCPKCGSQNFTMIMTRKLYQCSSCKHQVSVTAGTLFHATKIPLVKWFWAIYLSYGKKAGLALPAHPHMLRHACGFALADQGADTRLIQDYLGHRNIQHTVMYTATKPARFERLWR